MSKLFKIKYFYVVYAVFAIVMAIQAIVSTIQREQVEPEHPYTEYNNYVIFKNSSEHLQSGLNLYQLFELEQWDFYKYSPTFALLFGFFNAFPDWLGIVLWNLINAVVFIYAISTLNFLNEKNKVIFALLALLEMNTNLANTQANGLMAGLMLLFYSNQEKGNYGLGNFLLALSVFVKIFSLAGFLMLFFYPNWWKRVRNAIFWGVFFLILPLLVISPSELANQYLNWLELLKIDSEFGAGLSFNRLASIIIGFEFNKSWGLLFGISVFLMLFVKSLLQRNSFIIKNLFWAQLMIWVVIFNHRAESPTFIISVAGIYLGLFNWVDSKKHFYLLAFFSLFLTSLTSTDLFSGQETKAWLFEFSIKAVPSVFIWFYFAFHILFSDKKISEKIN